MNRELTAETMVHLPKLTASSAVALAEQLLTTAAAEKGDGLPVLIERPRVRVEVALLGLRVELTPQETVDTQLAISADWTVDGAWRSLHDWTSALTGMPDGSFPEQEQLRSFKATVFKDGMTFINLSYREEWVQSEARLIATAEGGFEPVIEQLGGAPLLKNLKAAHARYGEVLGIRSAMKAEENPKIREKMTALLAAMKSYVLKVAAWADPEDAASETLSAALLLPLLKWKRSSSKKHPGDENVVTPDPEVEKTA